MTFDIHGNWVIFKREYNGASPEAKAFMDKAIACGIARMANETPTKQPQETISRVVGDGK